MTTTTSSSPQDDSYQLRGKDLASPPPTTDYPIALRGIISSGGSADNLVVNVNVTASARVPSVLVSI